MIGLISSTCQHSWHYRPPRLGGEGFGFPPRGLGIWGGKINSPPKVSESGGGRFLADPQNPSSPPKTGGQIGLPPPKLGVKLAFPPQNWGSKPPKFSPAALFSFPPQPQESDILNFLGGEAIPPPGSQIMGVGFPPPGSQNVGGGKCIPPPSFGGRMPTMM